MADFRQIHTRIWKDDYFLNLEPEAKLLFIYLFSNEQSAMCGLYKLPVKVMSFETGIPVDRVEHYLDLFTSAGKVLRQDSIIWVKNMSRYHEARSASQQLKVSRELAMIPDSNIKTAYLEEHSEIIAAQYPGVTSMAALRDAKLGEDDDETNNLVVAVQTLAGLMPTPADLQILDAWEREGVIPDDIRSAIAWRVENNVKPARYVAHLSNGVKTARLKRIQGETGETEPAAPTKKPYASEVW